MLNLRLVVLDGVVMLTLVLVVLDSDAYTGSGNAGW
jgi:hypothetical protein